jgi:hypothetical protein
MLNEDGGADKDFFPIQNQQSSFSSIVNRAR